MDRAKNSESQLKVLEEHLRQVLDPEMDESILERGFIESTAVG